jgi:hypothetical protein
MKCTTTWTASQATSRTSRAHLTRRISTGALAVAIALVSQASLADEGGVSFWIPGFFGSLAAAPLQPGWSLQTNYYHTSVSLGICRGEPCPRLEHLDHIHDLAGCAHAERTVAKAADHEIARPLLGSGSDLVHST